MALLGEKIKNLRIAHHMTQTELAKKLDVATSTVSYYENNMRLPSYVVLVKISRLFGITTDSLLMEKRNGVYFDTDKLTKDQVKLLFQLVDLFESANVENEEIKALKEKLQSVGDTE